MSWSPTLINPGDSFIAKCLVTGFESVTVSGRVVGVREIVPFKKHQSMNRLWYFLSFVMILAGFMWVTINPVRIPTLVGAAQMFLFFGGWAVQFVMRRMDLYSRFRRQVRKKHDYEIRDYFDIDRYAA